MNEFTAKKLGEVLAFCRVGVETLERGGAALASVSTEEKVQEWALELKDQAQQIESLTQEKEITLQKAEATGKKLVAMRDMYVGDEWDNPAELLEWSGFFEGAAIVHWALVQGAADALDNSSLADLAEDARSFHEDMLIGVSESLENIGNSKAQVA
jgi:hypothetical protein